MPNKHTTSKIDGEKTKRWGKESSRPKRNKAKDTRQRKGKKKR